MKTILTNCTVIDCTGKAPMPDMTVIIEGDKIAALNVGSSSGAVEGETRVFDLGEGYVLPGLWNVHAHLGDLYPDVKHLTTRESAIDWAIRAGRNAMDALRSGVTGIRVVGERDFVDVAWKRAFDSGIFVGPRLFVCGKPISSTQGDLRGGVDGPYEIRKAVRENLKHGVDQIKLMVTAGHAEMIASGVAESMQEIRLLPDEVRAATEIAHQKGKRVCAHASNPGIKMAIRCGVDCIEHGYFLDDEAIEMMVENGVYLVPTLVCNLDEEFLHESDISDLNRGEADSALQGRLVVAKAEGVTPEYVRIHREGFQKALKAGVKIACGGDDSPIGQFTLWELEHLVWAGMTEMEALIAATRTSADLCKVADQLGTVEVGKLADLIAVSADPLENISNIRKLKLVLKGGKLVETREQEGLGDFWDVFFF
jgi:imidazolonepropionase-like amidohydrolase